jgi:hypothetical protein
MATREEDILQILSDNRYKAFDQIDHLLTQMGHAPHPQLTGAALEGMLRVGRIASVLTDRDPNTTYYGLISAPPQSPELDPTRPVTQRGTPTLNEPLPPEK